MFQTEVICGLEVSPSIRSTSLLYDSTIFPLPLFQKAALSIHHLCSLVSSSDEALAAKCCQLIVSYILKQNVQIGGSILSLSVHWCLEAIKYAETFPALCNLLQGLEALLRSNNLNDLDVSNCFFFLNQFLNCLHHIVWPGFSQFNKF